MTPDQLAALWATAWPVITAIVALASTPKRATKSCRRKFFLNNSPNCRSNSSPAKCPQVSLTTLN